jgi:hypothetical protein
MGFITGIILPAIAIGVILALIKLHFEVRPKIGENRKNDIALRLQKYEEGFKLIEERQKEKRIARFQEHYEFLAKSATEITERADLDKTRKGQMIHDLATQLDFNSEQLEEFEKASLERLVE